MIILAATPIGNHDDASPRLVSAFTQADVIAAEDTRKLHDLLRRINVTTQARIVSYHEHNEAERTPDLIEAAQRGEQVVVVTDAGTPGVSDPGYRLVKAAHESGVGLTHLPGPSAVVAALVVSGLPTDRFCFEGFLPRKTGARRAVLEQLGHEQRTMVFYEAPHRVGATVAAMIEVFGPTRPAALCRELTKTHEEVLSATLADIAERITRGVKGEVVLVVGGAPQDRVDLPQAVHMVRQRMEAGHTMKDAVSQVAEETGLRRRGLYEAVLHAD